MTHAPITIISTPADVPVLDDRRTVRGGSVVVTVGGVVFASGSVIPPEGTSLDCWVDASFLAAPEGMYEWVEVLEMAATDDEPFVVRFEWDTDTDAYEQVWGEEAFEEAFAMDGAL